MAKELKHSLEEQLNQLKDKLIQGIKESIQMKLKELNNSHS